VGHKLGDTQLAESTLRQAIEIDPNSELVLAALAKLHAATGNFAKAKEAVALLVKLNSSPEVLQLKEYIEKAASQAVVDPP
jgi:Tfp pilus assembly protein PilF